MSNHRRMDTLEACPVCGNDFFPWSESRQHPRRVCSRKCLADLRRGDTLSESSRSDRAFINALREFVYGYGPLYEPRHPPSDLKRFARTFPGEYTTGQVPARIVA